MDLNREKQRAWQQKSVLTRLEEESRKGGALDARPLSETERKQESGKSVGWRARFMGSRTDTAKREKEKARLKMQKERLN